MATLTDYMPFRLCLGMYATDRDHVAHALSCKYEQINVIHG
jgi:hypothetical protein